MASPLAAVRKFVTDLLLWTFFACGLAASTGAGAVLDGTQKDAATAVGGVVSLLAGSRIAKKPRIKAFLSRPGTLWFLFLFNGGTAVAMYFAMDGVKGVIAAAAMGLVSWARPAASSRVTASAAGPRAAPPPRPPGPEPRHAPVSARSGVPMLTKMGLCAADAVVVAVLIALALVPHPDPRPHHLRERPERRQGPAGRRQRLPRQGRQPRRPAVGHPHRRGR